MADAYLVAADAGDGSRLIAVCGDVDMVSAEALHRRLTALAGSAPRRITLDLSRVTFIDCSGLRALDALARQVQVTGGSTRVGKLSPAAARLFELLGRPDLAWACEDGPRRS